MKGINFLQKIFIIMIAAVLFASCGSDNSEQQAPTTGIYPNGMNPNSVYYNQTATAVRSQVESIYVNNTYASSGQATTDSFRYDQYGTTGNLFNIISWDFSFDSPNPWTKIDTTSEYYSSFNDGYATLLSTVFDNVQFTQYVQNKMTFAGMIYQGVFEVVHIGTVYDYATRAEVTHEIRSVIDTNQPAKANPIEYTYLRTSKVQLNPYDPNSIVMQIAGEAKVKRLVSNKN